MCRIESPQKQALALKLLPPTLPLFASFVREPPPFAAPFEHPFRSTLACGARVVVFAWVLGELWWGGCLSLSQCGEHLTLIL